MSKGQREALAKIRRFDQLIAFLRDEMGWPIKSDDFEELTFDYTPEELGIDPKTAANIDEIKRLRPFEASQPWGIFFVKFEPKRLPVVALRRILGGVTLKKRASGNAAEQKKWATEDLLFISNYGEGADRQISFAHFSAPKGSRQLPVLKVLGWDSLDTQLHLEDVADTLIDDLSWPGDESDNEAWRERWSSAFTLQHREVITTSKELSNRLAELARNIRDRIKAGLEIETAEGPLTKLMKAFRVALVHDLDETGFADMYAQTIAYGLLSARIADPGKKNRGDLAMHLRTNPLLRDLMAAFLEVGGKQGSSGGVGIDFDELGVGEVVDLLDDANMEAVVLDFGDKNPHEDPVIHFYEHFLSAYNKKQKVSRGVFYTPRPIVSYIVRSVDDLLRTEFGLEDGLADTTTWGEMIESRKDLKIPDGTSPGEAFVQILDPATGTGTFLVEAIDIIHKTMVEKWRGQGHIEKRIHALWNEYVPEHLLSRLHGYELLMAPYAIAHLKIGLKLLETGYDFESDERARVYLTNSLEPPGDGQLTLDLLPALAHEARAVNKVKRDQRFTVVIGNPPYSGISSNKGPWIDGLLKGRLPDGTTTSSYYLVDGEPLGERKVWLQDDYVKFIRLSQLLLDTTGSGIHCYISNHGYLDNPTFRGMRWSLMQSFSRIRVLDLHGNINKKETTPTGGRDINVFDIQQGVAIGLFTKLVGARSVCHADLWGGREVKYRWLLDHDSSGTAWATLEPVAPFYLFEPFDDAGTETYSGWPAIDEMMPVNVTGVVTARDGFVIDFEPIALLDRIRIFLDKGLSDGEVMERLGLKENYAWRVAKARRELREATEKKRTEGMVAKILYRPFDVRFIFWHPSVVWRPRTEAMPHMLAGKNVGLITTRQTRDEWGALATTRIIAHKTCSAYDINSVFPLYLYPGVGKAEPMLFSRWSEGKDGRTPNLGSQLVEQISEITDLDFVSDGRGDLRRQFGPEDVLGWIYAVFHSPGYRERYEAQLKLDFPRVPFPGTSDLFRDLAVRGHDLLALHLLESPKIDEFITNYTGPEHPVVGRVGWSGGNVWLDAGKTNALQGHRATKPGSIGLKGVPEEVWDFQIGGYQVCHKWLKDRKGRALAEDDIAHYQKIIVAISETIRIMGEIDDVIQKHGGWPDAFVTETADSKQDDYKMAAESGPEYETDNDSK